MSNEQDMLIFKLQNDLARARLALTKYTRQQTKYTTGTKGWAIGELECEDGELRAYSEELEHENGALQYKLDKAVEALRFYSDHNCYEKFGHFGLSEIDKDGGEMANKILEEIGNTLNVKALFGGITTDTHAKKEVFPIGI